MPAATVLLVSSDRSLIKSVQGVLESLGQLRLQLIPTIPEACRHVEQQALALMVVHAGPRDDADGVGKLLQAAGRAPKPVATLVVAEVNQPQHAVRLLRQGAADYLLRPLDLRRFAYLVDTLTVRSRIQGQEHAAVESQAPSVAVLGDEEPFLYPVTGELGDVMEQVQRVAQQDTTLLLTGETGTGKSRLARLIHQISPRRQEPFMVAHCGALSANLIESEMFGHVKGAFTNADRDRTGKFAEVGRGTLLLDEIDALPVELQAKLLRVVEERVFEPVGSNRSIRMQARLIVASNRVLTKEVEAGRFRADLYYRLNVVGFYLPPLRERREMIAALTEHFIAQCASEGTGTPRGITPVALSALESYEWPGNIRELRNVIERALVLSSSKLIQLEDLPQALRHANSRLQATPSGTASGETRKPTLAQAKDDAEAALISEALERNNNNRLRTAAELGISRMTLYKKLHRYGLLGA